MTPAFGFSVGDFISAIGLVRKVSKALKETGGASAEYQQVVIELHGLENILRQLEAFELTEDNVDHVNAVRGMALACQYPLRAFLTKLEKFEAALGPFADKRSFQGVVKKSEWAVMMSEEVQRLRAVVAAKNISINILLNMNTLQTLSRVDARAKEKHRDLMSKVAEHRAALHQVGGRITQIEEKVSQATVASKHHFDAIEEKICQAGSASNQRLDHISSEIYHTKISIMNFHRIGKQFLRYLATFPRETRGLLEKILRGNWQMYQVLLKIQNNTAQSPTGLSESNIRFEDALGDYQQLPYIIFRHWEPFEGFLRSRFKDKPGERKVLEGQYHIIDVSNDRAIVRSEHWTRSINEGATLTMSMLMPRLQTKAGCCPRPSCLGQGITQCHVSGLPSCNTCSLKFHLRSEDLEALSSAITQEEQVAKLQAEEDLRLYGSRPEPADAVEIDKPLSVASLTSIQPSSNLKTPIINPGKNTENHTSASNEKEALSSLDWNAGDSPLSAWLNQSAIPSVILMPIILLDQIAPTDSDLLGQEAKEIEAFRTVHMATPPEPNEHITHAFSDEGALELELPAQIYYRNIVDRYPALPVYLARRLAEANSIRAERLSSQRDRATVGAKAISTRTIAADPLSTSQDAEAVPISRPVSRKLRPSNGKSHWVYDYTGPPSKYYNYSGAATQTSRKPRSTPGTYGGIYNYAEPPPEYYAYPERVKQTSRAKPLSRRSKVQQQPQSAKPTARKSKKQQQSQSDFWSGGTAYHRPKSRSSSKNSSLHGSSDFHKDYQNTCHLPPEQKSTPYSYTSPGLPPPPVNKHNQKKWRNKTRKLTFDCDICGENVMVDRRRQWQKHVIKDLRPYVCTVVNCDQGSAPFQSLKEYLNHEIEIHELGGELLSLHSVESMREMSIVCIFCGELTEVGRGKNGRGRHIGRHMEEIAFTVVSKTYEEWQFYSESSSAQSLPSWRRKKPNYKQMPAAKRANPPSKQGPPRREATVADAAKHEIPAGYSLRNWDPTESPILLLGSVFDANSLGKWIYDWTVFHHGPSTASVETSGDLWLLLIEISSKMAETEEVLLRVRKDENAEILEEFLQSGDRLWLRFKKLLKACEEFMWSCRGAERKVKLGKNSGIEFVDTMFGPDRESEETQRLMQSMRLWTMRFEANCSNIVRRPSAA